MSIVHCSKCDRDIDTDFDAELIADWDESICVDCADSEDSEEEPCQP